VGAKTSAKVAAKTRGKVGKTTAKNPAKTKIAAAAPAPKQANQAHARATRWIKRVSNRIKSPAAAGQPAQRGGVRVASKTGAQAR
jgi:hypothetical protein